ncbi:MAG: hypothetical protein AB7E49_10880 [Campylobacterales bacterium]
MKRILLTLLAPLMLYAHGPVLKYAYNDTELGRNAAKTAQLLKEHNVHLGLIENSPLFEKEGGLAALKMGYIEFYGANAVELQYVISGIWPKLEAAKAGNDGTLRKELNELGFELISLRFLPKKTLMVLGNANALGKLPAQERRILMQNL